MQLAEAMEQLAAAGTAQGRKIYARHGAPEPMFGVSYAVLRKLHKTIKTDHALARQLWATGNHDARILATLVADPKQATPDLIATWTADVSCYPLADQVAEYLARTAQAAELAARWTASGDEWLGRIGWHLVARLALSPNVLPDAVFEEYLATIEQRIHAAPNIARHGMNNVLIAIGLRNAHLEQLALAAAARIGPVVVDHGATGCKTPDATAYIARARARKAS